MNRQADMQINRQTDRQTDRGIDSEIVYRPYQYVVRIAKEYKEDLIIRNRTLTR